jgi:signal peptidase II
MPKAIPWFGISVLVVLLDFATKWMVMGSFSPGEGRFVTPFFNLVLVFNKGAAFSFLAGAPGWQTPVLAAFSVVASIVISVLLVRNTSKKMLCGGLALILGGALGNLIDRLRFGQVVDFLDFHAMGWHWPAFNMADSAITVGAVVLILEGFVSRERRAGAPS